jgi:hypothetical protein
MLLNHYRYSSSTKYGTAFLWVNENIIMPEDRINPQPQEGENFENNNNTENTNGERFESDTQKLVRQHLEDKDHVITDDDIANIRVGMVPPEFDAATNIRFEGEDAIDAAENELLDRTERNKDDNLDDKRITPWDAVDPTK